MLYLFQTGHQPQLSIAELLAVFSMKKPNIQSIKRQNNNYLILVAKDWENFGLDNATGWQRLQQPKLRR